MVFSCVKLDHMADHKKFLAEYDLDFSSDQCTGDPGGACGVPGTEDAGKVRRLQEELTQESGRGFYVDEDDYWIWGMFYYNPYDKKLLINDRTGMNVSFNLARRAGKIIMFLLVLLLVSMPFMGVWLIYEERQPVELSYENGVLTASHTGTSYEIREEEIESAELLTEQIPLSKVNGSGMESLL